MASPAQRIMALFAGNKNQHGTHGLPELDPNGMKWAIKKTARTIKSPVTLAIWQKHLEGKQPLGVVPIMEDNTCVFGSIDVDKYDIDLIATVRKVEDTGLPLVPCRSKSGGLHLWIFFTEPVAAEIVQNILRDLAAQLGFADSEIFPKQTKILTERGDQGSWIVMPYFGGTFDGRLHLQHGLKKNGADMVLTEFLALAEKRRITPQQATDMLAQPQAKSAMTGKKKKSSGNANGIRPDIAYSDGPPCLQHLASSGFPEGGRNNALFHIGVYLKKAHPTDWQNHLMLDNQAHMKPPLPADEVNVVIKSLEKKDYEYKCKDQPMVSHCNSVVCRGRKHGVGVGGSYPEILGIDKLDTEPPVWFVRIPGHTIPMNTEELQNYQRFHRKCMDAANIVYRMIPMPVWFSLIAEVVEKAGTLPAPVDIGIDGIFKEHVENFLTNRMRGKDRVDILRGAPWEDEEKQKHFFTMASLEKYLSREGVKMDRASIKYRVEKLSGVKDCHEPLTIKKGINRYCWWIPSSKIENAPELDTPKMPKEVM